MVGLNVEIHVEEGGLVQERFGRDLNGELTLAELLEYTKQSLILVSDEVLKDEQSRGFDKNPIVVVDGSVNKKIEFVNPLGTIDFVASAYIGDILLGAYKSLLDRSPVLTGHYKTQHFVFWNGQQIATDLAGFEAWINSGPSLTDKDKIRFVDIAPYARKLERLGVTAQTQGMHGRDRTRNSTSRRKGKKPVTKYNQPNGVYYLTNKELQSKYKSNAAIKFEFVTGTALGIAGDPTVNRKFRTGRKASQIGRAYLYPSIVISVRADGVV
jgi:hypothetical protein